jgi:hypothetical protein
VSEGIIVRGRHDALTAKRAGVFEDDGTGRARFALSAVTINRCLLAEYKAGRTM